MAMVATREFDNPVASSEPSSHPNRTHGGFRSRTHQSHPLHAWESSQDQLSDTRFVLSRSAIRGAQMSRADNRFDDLFMSVPQDHGAPRADVIDESIAVQIE